MCPRLTRLWRPRVPKPCPPFKSRVLPAGAARFLGRFAARAGRALPETAPPDLLAWAANPSGAVLNSPNERSSREMQSRKVRMLSRKKKLPTGYEGDLWRPGVLHDTPEARVARIACGTPIFARRTGKARQIRNPGPPDCGRHAESWPPDRKNAAYLKPGSPRLRGARRFFGAGP